MKDLREVNEELKSVAKILDNYADALHTVGNEQLSNALAICSIRILEAASDMNKISTEETLDRFKGAQNMVTDTVKTIFDMYDK